MGHADGAAGGNLIGVMCGLDARRANTGPEAPQPCPVSGIAAPELACPTVVRRARFVLTPLASNASELVSSLRFAARKRPRAISLTLSQIYGAVCGPCAHTADSLNVFLPLIGDGVLLAEWGDDKACLLAHGGHRVPGCRGNPMSIAGMHLA